MPDDRLAQHRRAETTPRPAHRVEGEAADARACAESVIGKERVSVRPAAIWFTGELPAISGYFADSAANCSRYLLAVKGAVCLSRYDSI
jgi:hypothetical protein